jgi:hypothetical protein
MAINFPNSPADGALFTVNGKRWVWSNATSTWSVFTANTESTVYTFGGTGVPLVGSDVTPWILVRTTGTCSDLSLVSKYAPSGGSFQVDIRASTDNGNTFPSSIGNVAISSGTNVANVSLDVVILQGTLLRCDVVSVNLASDWNCQLKVI